MTTGEVLGECPFYNKSGTKRTPLQCLDFARRNFVASKYHPPSESCYIADYDKDFTKELALYEEVIEDCKAALIGCCNYSSFPNSENGKEGTFDRKQLIPQMSNFTRHIQIKSQ